MRSFRLIAELTDWTADRGAAVWRPADLDVGAERPSTVPGTLLLEALVQCAGLILQRTDPDPHVFWMLAGVDDAEVGVARWDDIVVVEAVIRQQNRAAATAEVTAVAHDLVVCRAGLFMVHTST